MHKRMFIYVVGGLTALACLIAAAGAAIAETATYTYDAAHRLIQVNENGTIIEYQYDSVGNLMQRLRRYIVTATPTEKSFGSVQPGNSSAPQTFTITNAGTASVTLGTVGLTGADAPSFALTNSCAGLLQPSASCNLQASFGPASAGFKSGGIELTFNDPSSLKLDIPLAGFGYFNAVRILRGAPVYFTSLQAAYAAAASGETIQIQAGTLVENNILNRDISVTVEGGYDTNFASNDGGMTFLQGAVRTSAGTTLMRNMRVIQ